MWLLYAQPGGQTGSLWVCVSRCDQSAWTAPKTKLGMMHILPAQVCSCI